MTRNTRRILEFGGLGVVTVALYVLISPIASIRRTQNCQSNMKMIGIAMIQYVRDYDETWVTPNDWQTKIAPYLSLGKEKFVCPETKNSYALNHWITGHGAAKFSNPQKTPMAFESNGAQNQPCDGGTSWANPAAHWDRKSGLYLNSMVWLDGHATLIPAAPKPNFAFK